MSCISHVGMEQGSVTLLDLGEDQVKVSGEYLTGRMSTCRST